MSADGHRTKWCGNIAENFNRLSRAHERDRQTDRRQTDRWSMTYSEREREFSSRSLKTDFIFSGVIRVGVTRGGN